MRLMAGKIAVVLLLGTLVSGCSWFGDDEEEVRQPAELTSFKAERRLKQQWSVNVGDGPEDSAIKLVPAVDGGRVYAASADGNLVAVSTGTGKTVWKLSIVDFYSKEEQAIAFAADIDVITGGVGIGEGLVVVGSSAGEVVAVNQADGSFAWRAITTSEVLAPPVVANGRVFAQSIDGRVAAFNAETGSRDWLFSTTVPSLTLRGTSTPLAREDMLIAGFANGRVAVLNQAQGFAGFEQRVAVASGASDLEKLVDIDGAMLYSGGVIYAVSYQGNLVAIDVSQKGRIRWGREASSLAGLGEGFGNIYVAYEDSRLGAIDMQTSRDVWEINSLLYRDITRPVPVSSYVAVGDFEGYVHLVAQVDGRFVAREKVDGDGLTAPLVADGSRLYVMTNSGKLVALEVQ